jgi:hypothetical protein
MYEFIVPAAIVDSSQSRVKVRPEFTTLLAPNSSGDHQTKVRYD